MSTACGASCFGECAAAQSSRGKHNRQAALTEHRPLVVGQVVLLVVSVQQRRVRVASKQPTSCSHRAFSAGCGASRFADMVVQQRRVRVVNTQPTGCSHRASSAGCGSSCFAVDGCAAAQSVRDGQTAEKMFSQSIVRWLRSKLFCCW